jgi:hypothetical protein
VKAAFDAFHGDLIKTDGNIQNPGITLFWGAIFLNFLFWECGSSELFCRKVR